MLSEKNVLIVGKAMATLIGPSLEDERAKVHVVDNLADVVAILPSQKFDAILVDQNLIDKAYLDSVEKLVGDEIPLVVLSTGGTDPAMESPSGSMRLASTAEQVALGVRTAIERKKVRDKFNPVLTKIQLVIDHLEKRQ